MRLIETKCPKCGAEMNVDMDLGQCFCMFCGSKLLIDDQKVHMVYDNASDSGYEFEKGRQRAQAELELKKIQAQHEERMREIRRQEEAKAQVAFAEKQKKEKQKTIIWGFFIVIALILLFKCLTEGAGYGVMMCIICWFLTIVFFVLDAKRVIIFFKSLKNDDFNKSMFSQQNRFLLRIFGSAFLALFGLIASIIKAVFL